MLAAEANDEPIPLERKSYAEWVRSAVAMARSRRGDIISLFESSVPEPRELLRQAMVQTATPEFSNYYVSAFGDGNPFVRDMLAERYGVSREEILCTTGATGALSLIYRTFLKPGDHILVETPGFDLFSGLAEAQGVMVDAFARFGDTFTINLAEVEARIRPDTRLIVLSNLHNPSGMLVEQSLLQALADMAERRGILLVVDEVYGDYASRSERPSAAAALSPAVISVSSLTKIYGLGALRCGWIVAAPEVIAPIRSMNSRVEFGVSTLSHAVAAQILSDTSPFETYTQNHIGRCRPVFETWFQRMLQEGLMGGMLPGNGCICFPSLPAIRDTRAFSEWLLERSGVVVAPGEHFGAPGRIRIGFCQKEGQLEASLAALEDGLRHYPKEAGRQR